MAFVFGFIVGGILVGGITGYVMKVGKDKALDQMVSLKTSAEDELRKLKNDFKKS